MDLRAEISQSKDHSSAESDQNKLLNVDSGKILNPMPLSCYNPFDIKAKKQGNVTLGRWNPYDDIKANKQGNKVVQGKASKKAKKTSIVDVAKLACVVKENEIVSGVQGKASVVQEMKNVPDDSRSIISAVVSDLANENVLSVVQKNEKEKEKEKVKEKEKEKEKHKLPPEEKMTIILEAVKNREARERM